jgi:hypothetical protein
MIVAVEDNAATPGHAIGNDRWRAVQDHHIHIVHPQCLDERPADLGDITPRRGLLQSSSVRGSTKRATSTSLRRWVRPIALEPKR